MAINDVLLIIIFVQTLIIMVLSGKLEHSIPLEIARELVGTAKERAKATEGTLDDRAVGIVEKTVNALIGFFNRNPDAPTTPPTDPPVDPPPTTPPSELKRLNQNHKLLGDNVVAPIETPDGRYQFLPNNYTIIIEPGSVGVPPYINKVPNAAGDGNHAKIEVTQLNGKFGYSSYVVLEAGKCYFLKLSGSWQFEQANAGNGSLQDLRLSGRVVTDEGAITVLASEGFTSWYGGGEVIFPFRAEINTGAFVGGFIDITWASIKGVYELQAFEVYEAPAGYCSGGVPAVTGAQG